MLCQKTVRLSASAQDSSPESTAPDWLGSKADVLASCVSVKKCLNLPFRDYRWQTGQRQRHRRLYRLMTMKMCWQNGAWQKFFTEKPEPLTREEKRAWLDYINGVALGSDAFFPFGDNIERAAKSGVTYIAEPGGSIRDDNVIETCNKFGMVMAFTGMRLFHH